MCEKIIEQAEIQISAHLESAIPLAAIIVAVSGDRPALMELLLGHIYAACPLTIPRYVSRKSAQTESEYKTSLGYHSGESETTFLSRMNGIIALYAAITQTEARGKNLHPLQHAWTWFARILNMKPKEKITASVLHTFLKLAAYPLHQSYQRQFAKILQLIVEEFMAMIPESPEKQTLLLFCEQIAKEGLRPLDVLK